MLTLLMIELLFEDTERTRQGGDNEGEPKSHTEEPKEKVQDVARKTGSTIQETLQGGQEKRGKEGLEYGQDGTF